MLTNQQLQALKNDILADPAFLGMQADQIAGAYNSPAAIDYTVWKSDVYTKDIMKGGIDWTRVDNLSVGKARIWDWMTEDGSFDASKANVRAGIDAVWVGTAADLAVRNFVYTFCKRLATRGEKLLATGTGSVASPATMGYEGRLTYQDVEAALALP